MQAGTPVTNSDYQRQRLGCSKTLFWAWLAACGVAVALLVAGCANPELAAYKATGVTVVTVDSAMSAWGDYVRTGMVGTNEEARVRAGYDKYYRTVLVEKAAILSYKANHDTNVLFRVTGAVAAASADVISLIETFLPADKVVKLKDH